MHRLPACTVCLCRWVRATFLNHSNLPGSDHFPFCCFPPSCLCMCTEWSAIALEKHTLFAKVSTFSNSKELCHSTLKSNAMTPPPKWASPSVWTHLKECTIHICTYLCILICMCALLPVTMIIIIRMHFIKLYKVKGNAPVIFDCCYESTKNISQSHKKMCFFLHTIHKIFINFDLIRI